MSAKFWPSFRSIHQLMAITRFLYGRQDRGGSFELLQLSYFCNWWHRCFSFDFLLFFECNCPANQTGQLELRPVSCFNSVFYLSFPARNKHTSQCLTLNKTTTTTTTWTSGMLAITYNNPSSNKRRRSGPDYSSSDQVQSSTMSDSSMVMIKYHNYSQFLSKYMA